MPETILLTGATGMIGTQVAFGLVKAGKKVIGIDRRESPFHHECYKHIIANLESIDDLQEVFRTCVIDRVVHLAALAHTAGVKDLSYDAYFNANVICAENIFTLAEEKKIPVLFISTADVYGFVKKIATPETEPHPVTVYGKTKLIAEQKLKDCCSEYDIFRFAPVYTDEIKRDIQKRYYFRYPKWAYIIGKGLDYEFLYIDTAVDNIVNWCDKNPKNSIFNIKNEKTINTAECLKAERSQGRARHILHFPRWLVCFGFCVIYCLTGKNKYTFLLNKAVHPLKTE